MRYNNVIKINCFVDDCELYATSLFQSTSYIQKAKFNADIRGVFIQSTLWTCIFWYCLLYLFITLSFITNYILFLIYQIWVWPERLQTMHLLGLCDVFTTRTCLTRVRAVPRYNVTFDTLEALNTVHPTIGIMPSGLPWVEPPSKIDGYLGPKTADCYDSPGNAGSQTKMKRNQYFYSVPYSEHSCFSEIQEFIKIVQPSIVTGIVSSSVCYINPRQYFRHLRGAAHLSYKPCWNIKNETTEKTEAKRSGSVLGLGSSSGPKSRREVKFKFASLSVRRSRICILRRRGHGVKIA